MIPPPAFSLFMICLVSLSTSEPTCPRGCACPVNDLRCAGVENLNFTLGDPFWHSVFLTRTSLGKVVCGEIDLVQSLRVLFLRDVGPPSAVCALLACSPHIKNVLVGEYEVSELEFCIETTFNDVIFRSVTS